MQAWEAGLTWVFVQSFVLMGGGFIAPYIRKITPRAALLGSLAGISITFISMRPALEMVMTPVIGAGLLCRHHGRAGSAACATSRACRAGWWPSSSAPSSPGARPLFGFNYGGLTAGGLKAARVASFGFSYPMPAVGHVFGGFQFIGIILVTAIPFGIYDLVEAMDNVESAAAARRLASRRPAC